MPTEREVRLSIDRELAKFDQEYGNLEANLERQIKLNARMTEMLVNETVGDSMTANKGRVIDKDTVKKMEILANSSQKLVAAQNSLVKTSKERASKMTEQERLEFLKRAILAMPTQARRDFITNLTERHNEARQKAVEMGIEEPREHDFLRLR